MLHFPRFLLNTLLLVAAQFGASGVCAFEKIAPGQVAIELPKIIQVRSRFVTLDDIAVLVSKDIPTLKRLMSIPLGHAPVSGEPVTLDRELLARWIHRQAGLSDKQIIWSGAPAVAVSVARSELSGEEIVKTAQAALHEWLSPLSQRSEVQVAHIPQDLLLPAGRVSLKARSLAGATLRKRMHIWVDIFVDDRFIRAIPISFVVSAYNLVPVAKTGLPAKVALNNEAIDFKEVDVSTQGAAVFKTSDPVALSKHRARRAVAAGEALSQRNTETIPAVQRGEPALLRAVTGAVALESQVEVLQDGYMGQMVRVKVPKATGSILARVTAPGKVEVQQ